MSGLAKKDLEKLFFFPFKITKQNGGSKVEKWGWVGGWVGRQTDQAATAINM